MFQKKIEEIFKELLNGFGTAGGILVVSYDSNVADQDKLLCKGL